MAERGAPRVPGARRRAPLLRPGRPRVRRGGARRHARPGQGRGRCWPASRPCSSRCRSSSCAGSTPQMVLSFLQDEHPQTITLVLAHMDRQAGGGGPQRPARAGPGRHRPPPRRHGPHLARHRQAGRVLPAAAPVHGAAAERVRAGRRPAAPRRHHQPQRPQHRAAHPRGPRDSAAPSSPRRCGRACSCSRTSASSRTARCRCCCARSTPRTSPSRSRASRRTCARSSSRNMSERAGVALVEDMDVLGPVRVKQVEEAQAAIIRQVRVARGVRRHRRLQGSRR